MKVNIEKLYEDVKLPTYQREGDAGADIYAHNFKRLIYPAQSPDGIWSESQDNLLEDREEVTLLPNCRLLVGAGFKLELPTGYELQVRPRSGLALNSGVTVINSPGTIDSNYRGEVGVILINQGFIPITIKKGERIAQAVLKQVEIAEWTEGSLSETTRGEDGFGSSGK